MIFMKTNEGNSYPVKLGIMLGSNKALPINSNQTNQNNPSSSRKASALGTPSNNYAFHHPSRLQIKPEEGNILPKIPNLNEKFIKTASNTFNYNKKISKTISAKKNFTINLKNNNINTTKMPGCTPYDPYLIDVCKKAIINVKSELPNYQEIIKKINDEFGIEDEDEKKNDLLITEPGILTSYKKFGNINFHHFNKENNTIQNQEFFNKTNSNFNKNNKKYNTLYNPNSSKKNKNNIFRSTFSLKK